jgi:RsiW-degrading membrane proteinase PrsW (M82 family)
LDFLLGFLPVCAFLAVLYSMDSYKLVPPGLLVGSISAGGIVAVAAYGLNVGLMHVINVPFEIFARYGAPLTEELLKSIPLAFLLFTRRTGFLVDAAIHGFAIGAGFALVENMVYVVSLPAATALLWLVRGFGTAMMHGGVTAIAGIVGMTLAGRGKRASALLPGVAAAMAIHSAFNHFFLPAVPSTLLIMILLPVMMALVFKRSESATRRWLGVGFDTDRELLAMVKSGRLVETPIGKFLVSLRSRFRGEVLADMLCVLRLHLELSIAAKGMMMMRDEGFDLPPDPEWKPKFDEIEYLDSSIGRTGRLAIEPFLHTSSRKLRQILRV